MADRPKTVPPKTDAPTPLLAFDTLIPNATIVIDGCAYDLRREDQLSLFQQKDYDKRREELRTILRLEEPTEAQQALASSHVRRMCEIVLDAPTDVHARLSDAQRTQIISAFITLPGPRLLTPAALRQKATATKLTGKTRSRGSSGSTAATRRVG